MGPKAVEYTLSFRAEPFAGCHVAMCIRKKQAVYVVHTNSASLGLTWVFPHVACVAVRLEFQAVSASVVSWASTSTIFESGFRRLGLAAVHRIFSC